MKSPRHSAEPVRLPVSGLPVTLRQPTGDDDLVLRESRLTPRELARTLAARLAQTVDGEPLDPDSLAVTDFQALLLRIRRAVAGDLIQAEVTCGAGECGARVDIAFRISEYLDSRPARQPRGVEGEECGWFRLEGEQERFRLPNVLDLRTIEGERQPDRELARRCMQPEQVA